MHLHVHVYKQCIHIFYCVYVCTFKKKNPLNNLSTYSQFYSCFKVCIPISILISFKIKLKFRSE